MKKIVRDIKKLIAGVLAIGMLSVGLVIVPQQAEATDTIDATKVICEAYADTDITMYWTPESKTAPLKAGYVFGGWFREKNASDTNAETLLLNGTEGEYAPLTTEEMSTLVSNNVAETVYAKFVPAQVLSVKAQNSSNVTSQETAESISTENPMWIRVISSIDSTNYTNLGFEIYLNNRLQATSDDGGPCESNKYYDSIWVGDENQGTEKDAEEIFGSPSKHLFVWRLNQIDTPSNVTKIIYVRPYWQTLDGTKVEGMAKYVHIEDEYLNLVSIPVNLFTGEDVAAGTLEVTYNQNLTLYGFEPGRILPDMRYYQDSTNKTIHIIGNTTTVGEGVAADGIFANIRFKQPSQDTTFNIHSLQFSDWEASDLIEIEKVWDVKYVVPTTSIK